MSDAAVFRWNRTKAGLFTAGFAVFIAAIWWGLSLDASNIQTMRRGRFETNQLILWLVLPAVVYMGALSAARFVVPTVLCPRFREGRLRVPVHPLVPRSQSFDLTEVRAVRKSFPFVVLTRESGKKVKITAHLLDDPVGFLAALEQRIDSATPSA